jgi:hypothetical protein
MIVRLHDSEVLATAVAILSSAVDVNDMGQNDFDKSRHSGDVSWTTDYGFH